MSWSRDIAHFRGVTRVFERSIDDIRADLASGWVLTDENVARAWASVLPDRKVLVLPAGEPTKSLEVFAQAQEWLAGHGAKRSTRVHLLGGGVIGDLGGFVAATYARGISYVQIPTSLLAMVDSSVGGKVGVDLPQGKNLVGAFAPPAEVWLTDEWLGTLPRRELVNGLAEVWKMAMIADLDLLQLLRKGPVGPGDPRLPTLIRHCIERKAEIVEQDEFERLGVRAQLNFGHTIGHAIEKALGYRELLHGEAISIGMVLEAEIGQRWGVTPPGTRDQLQKDLATQGLPTVLPQGIDPSLMLSAMHLDKKAVGSGLALSLLTGPGECKLFDNVAESVVREVMFD